jgi:hypothetical protein
MVEGAAQVVNEISDDDPDLGRRLSVDFGI